jgi:hypothetical protein
MARSRNKQKVFVREYPFDPERQGRHEITEAEVDTLRSYLPDWTPDSPKYGILRDIFIDEFGYSDSGCKGLSFDDVIGILRRRDRKVLRELVDRMKCEVEERMREDRPLRNKQARRVRNVAESVDKLVMDPVKMQHWRKHVGQTLGPGGRIKTEKDWLHVLVGINPKEDIGVLYTILAFCHDDRLRINPILTDKIRKLNPEMCRSPNICVYLRCNIDQMLNIYLCHVMRDLPHNDVLPSEEPSKLQPWNKDDLDYMSCSDAIVKLADNKMTLSTLSKMLTPNGQIHHMRRGRRCRVNIRDFRAYLKVCYGCGLSEELADELLADIETRKKEEHRRKSRKK